MSNHDTESLRSGVGKQQKGSVVDGSEVDDMRSSLGGSHLGYAGKKPPAAPAKSEAVELPQEMMLELVQAFCRDTRSDPASAAADKFRNSLITNAGDSAVRLRNSRLGMHSGVCMGKVFKTHPLATLDLQGNVMRDVGAIALIALLRGHETLKHLTLGYPPRPTSFRCDRSPTRADSQVKCFHRLANKIGESTLESRQKTMVNSMCGSPDELAAFYILYRQVFQVP